MPTKALVEQPSSPLRRHARRVIPFSLRSSATRLPHLLRWLRSAPEVERAPAEGVLISHRSSPLRRPSTTYEPALQAAKETNVQRVIRALHGVRIPPGGRLSWHEIVGPPLSIRGFVSGPELHDGAIARGAGGGACQVANLLFWLGATAGLQLIERHRHGLDLFPDHQRSVPFGCGATVFYPHRDLIFHNPHSTGVRISLHIEAGSVIGRLFAEAPLDATWELVEVNHRFFQRDGATWRANTILRRRHHASGSTDAVLVDNLARVVYPVPSHLLES